jgi:hypothetical protein
MYNPLSRQAIEKSELESWFQPRVDMCQSLWADSCR